MLRREAQRWWVVALRGLAAVVFGVVAFVWPNLTLAAIIVLYGAFAVTDGVLGLVGLLFGLRRVVPQWFQAVDALLSLVAGLIAWFWPGLTSIALVWIIAAWALARGILQLVLAVRLRESLANPWTLVLVGVLSLILGVVFRDDLVAPIAIIGVVLVIGGAFLASRRER